MEEIFDPSEHHCHAMGCRYKVSPKMFMCRKHWFMLTAQQRKDVWGVYIPGQEIRKDPTEQYLEVTRAAIRYVAEKEGLV